MGINFNIIIRVMLGALTPRKTLDRSWLFSSLGFDSREKNEDNNIETISWNNCNLPSNLKFLDTIKRMDHLNRKKILVSTCLLGERVRYDGQILPNLSPILKEWAEQGLIIAVCPEVAGGLPIPRPPAEVENGNGEDVILGKTKVIDVNGKDVTSEFLKGAGEALELVEENDLEYAILKARSPSCRNKLN